MKKTTYILLGVIGGSFLLILGIFIVLSYVGIPENTYKVTFNGKAKTITLPPCTIIECGLNVNIKEKKYIDEECSMQINPSETSDNILTIPADLEKYMVLKSKGDTLKILFDFTNIKKDALENEQLQISTAQTVACNLQLSIAPATRGIISTIDLGVNNIKRDIMTIISERGIVMNDCDISLLTTHANKFRLASGKIGNMYLNVDNVYAWSVDTEKGMIGTAHISGSRRHTMNMDGCDTLILSPKNDNAQLIFESKESVIITRNNK